MEVPPYEMDAYDFYEDDDDDDREFPYSYEEMEESPQQESTLLFREVLKYCVQPTILDVYNNLMKLFILCLLFRFTVQNGRLPQFLVHFMSAVFSLVICYLFFDSQFLIIFGTAVLSYAWFSCVRHVIKSNSGFLVSVPMLMLLVVCELLFPSTWQRIRGVQMGIAMKVISMAFDITSKKIEEPSTLQFMGYVLHVGTSIFGPWISYSDYKALTTPGQWKWDWLRTTFVDFALSLLYFTLSVCFVEWLIPESSNDFYIIYRQALLFRVGHYFVSYVSQVASVLSGLRADLRVTSPWQIEVPHSLVQVVVNWNIPMHGWLKNYVFKTTRRKGGNFVAVMSTYLVSSLLHGLNFRLAGILLSLGYYTYVEHIFREKLATKFEACIRARPCPPICEQHKFSRDNLIVNTFNVFFTVLGIVHLAYLGALLDVSDSANTPLSEAFDLWVDLKFASHWIVITTHALSFCI